MATFDGLAGHVEHVTELSEYAVIALRQGGSRVGQPQQTKATGDHFGQRHRLDAAVRWDEKERPVVTRTCHLDLRLRFRAQARTYVV